MPHKDLKLGIYLWPCIPLLKLAKNLLPGIWGVGCGVSAAFEGGAGGGRLLYLPGGAVCVRVGERRGWALPLNLALRVSFAIP